MVNSFLLCKQKNEKIFFVVSAACFLCMLIYLLWFVQRGMGYGDESFYLSIPHRLLLGDRLIIDEWHVSQFFSTILYLPFMLYYRIFGTEGSMLCFRYLYVVCQSSVSLFLFFKFRKYGYPALLYSLLFNHYIVVFALSYYNVSVMMCTVVCLLLFIGKKQKSWISLFLTGVAFSFAVLSEPLLALLYFLFFFAVIIIRIFKKEYSKGVLSLRYLIFISLGILLCVSFFFSFMASKASLCEYFAAVPNLFTDSEFSFPLIGDSPQNLIDNDLFVALSHIGLPLFIADGVLLLIIALDTKRRERREWYIAAAGIICLLTLLFVYLNGRDLTFTSIPRYIPFFVFGAFCIILLQNKRENAGYICIYIGGAVYSLILDISSEYYIGVCLLGGLFANVAAMAVAVALYAEMISVVDTVPKKSRKKCISPSQKKIRKISSVVLAAVILASPVSEAFAFVFEIDYPFFEKRNGGYEERLDTELTSGPFKGIKTVASVAQKYNLMLEDLDRIKDRSEGPVFVFSHSWMYLYLDQPYAAYTTYYVDRDFCPRQIYYWKKNPEKIPEYIYIPKVENAGFKYMAEEKVDFSQRWLEYVHTFFECSAEETQIGYIIRITGLKKSAWDVVPDTL